MALLKHTRFFVSKKVKHPTWSDNHAACLGIPPIKAGECKNERLSILRIFPEARHILNK